jgi:hypothetical protein
MNLDSRFRGNDGREIPVRYVPPIALLESPLLEGI